MVACIKHENFKVCKGLNMQHIHEDSPPIAQVLASCLFNSAEVIYPPYYDVLFQISKIDPFRIN